MQVKFKLLNENAKLPNYAKPGDAGLDITATSKTKDELGNIVYGTGLSVEIPTGYVGLIFPRSSISKYDLSLSNAVGVVDSGYRGEISFKFKLTNEKNELQDVNCGTHVQTAWVHKVYEIGDKIGQLVILPFPKIAPVATDELTSSQRGSSGWGSSGR